MKKSQIIVDLPKKVKSKKIASVIFDVILMLNDSQEIELRCSAEEDDREMRNFPKSYRKMMKIVGRLLIRSSEGNEEGPYEVTCRIIMNEGCYRVIISRVRGA